MLVRYFALIMGMLFVMAGVGGFLPLITTDPPTDAHHLEVDTSYGYLLGLYPINLIHNLVHLTLGILGIAAYRSFEQARLYARGLCLLLTVFTILGVVAPTGFGVMPLFGHDIWLHGLEAIAAGYLGFFAPQAEIPNRQRV
jgi:hypothetical protein